MVDKDIIGQRLMKLEQALRKLKEISCHSWDEYRGSEALKDDFKEFAEYISKLKI